MSTAELLQALKTAERSLLLARELMLDLAAPLEHGGYLSTAICSVDTLLDELEPLTSREVPSQPLQSLDAASASATPRRSAKASHAAPAGLGTPGTRSRAGRLPASEQAACLPNKDATPAHLVAGEGRAPGA